MKIVNTVALVTGANRGIGRSLVETLVARGVRRVYATGRDAAGLASVAAVDRQRVQTLRLDITKPEQVRAAAEQARDTTLLINNAAVGNFGTLDQLPDDQIRSAMETNYFGTLGMINAFAPVLEANGGGAIVNIITVVALASVPRLGAYTASKAALWSLTQSYRADLAKRGISVHGVYPGPVDTDMARALDNFPKTPPAVVATNLLDGLEAGDEDIFPDVMARDVYSAWRQDHKAVERQFASMF
jgi:NAD(P)-dependent dehydrogenase (short-subunit alcohol dehydrogenase family)